MKKLTKGSQDFLPRKWLLEETVPSGTLEIYNYNNKKKL